MNLKNRLEIERNREFGGEIIGNSHQIVPYGGNQYRKMQFGNYGFGPKGVFREDKESGYQQIVERNHPTQREFKIKGEGRNQYVPILRKNILFLSLILN